MIPLSLKLKNFKGHSVSNIDFSLLSNAIAIIGNEDNSNKKSNAVGKTTIFQAIKYVLFNARTSKTKDGVIRRGTKKCNVVFDFTASDGSVYRVDRSRTAKTNNVSLFVRNNGQWEDKTQRRNGDTDKDILNIIGINLQTFENSLYFQQNDLFNLASATREKRKEIIKGMLSLAIWDKFKKVAAKQKDEDETRLKIINGKIQEYISEDDELEPEEELANLKSALTNTIKAKSKIEEEIIKIKNDLEEKTEKLNKLKNLAGNKDKVEEQYRNALLYKDEATDNYKKIVDDIEDTETDIRDLKDKLIIKKPMAEGLVTKIAELVKIETEQKPDLNKHEEIEKLFAAYNAEIRELEALKNRLDKKLPDDDYCPSCGSELDEKNREDLLKSKTTRIEDISSKLEELYVNKDDLLIELQNSQKEINEFEENKSNIEIYSSKLDVVKDEIDRLSERQDDLQQRLDWLCSKKDTAKTSMEKAVKGYDEAKELKVALMGQGFDEAQKLEEDIDFISDNLYDYESNYQEIIGMEAVAREKIINKEEIIGKIKKLKAEKKRIEYKYNVSSTGTFAFSSHGVPFMIISSVLDAIQTETNAVLSILRNGMQVQFEVDNNDKDTLDMKFFVGSEEWGWEDLSGGQQGSVALALKFAMAVVNRKRCGADVRLLMLDEVDQPLDPESVDFFYKIIKEWSKNMVIMVITHNEQLKAKFSDFILVKKQQGISTASVVVS
ncbi:MAG TPA: SMC family ATPase [Candidatus Glassbacteria bacterium]|nr:SMC family ATPase [Candidatus Glassbacteria bacterium]